MQIHELKRKHKIREKKRVGRGGKRGTTSGKGQKGQRSRAGHKIRPAERDMIQRLPKLRGVKNKPASDKGIILKTGTLHKFSESGKVTKEILVKKGIIKNIRQNVKVLYDKDLNEALVLEGLKVSEKAKKALEKAGGKVS